MQGRFIVGVFGMAGSGKTYLIIKMLPLVSRPVFIIDTQDDFSEGLVFTGGKQLWDYVASGKPNKSGIYTLKTRNDDDYNLFFRLIRQGEFPCTILVDEADIFCTPHAINPDLLAIVNYGRHEQQNIIYAARRYGRVNINLRSQSDCIISFAQIEKRDIDILSKSYSNAEQIYNLDAGKFEYVVMGRSEVTPIHKILTIHPVATTVSEPYNVDQGNNHAESPSESEDLP